MNITSTFQNKPKRGKTDPAQNFIERYPHPLDAIFYPQSVAVIGAKDDEGSVGRTIMLNLVQGGFKGPIYPINPKRSEVCGIRCYPDLKSVSAPIDLVIIVTPAKTVPSVVKECVDAKVKGVIIISAGFREVGPEGLRLEEEVLKLVQKANIPLIGPNCMGVMNPSFGLNATFAKGMALPGHTAFISQSGAMCSAVLDWSFEQKIGFSAFVSIGAMADINWGDLIDYLGGDPHTRSILLYMETVGDPRSFLSAAREIALEKPIIVIKPGRSQAAAQAAASHTGSLAGSDEVFNAALKRVGVLRVDSIAELFSMASVLSRQPLPKGPRLTIVTNAGGPAVLATDSTVMNGAELATLTDKTKNELSTFLPAAWSHSNPVDILGDASPEKYAKTLNVLAEDTGNDGILVILSPQDMTDALGTAEALKPFAHLKNKPIIASWMGGESVRAGTFLLNQASIPVFSYPDDAAKTFAEMWRYRQQLQALYETPELAFDWDATDTQKNEAAQQETHRLIDAVHKEGRTLLTEYESKTVLSACGIPVVETYFATSAREAIEIADKMGYPVVLKLHSRTITHKTDVGGVKLNLENPAAVSQAFDQIQQAVAAKAGSEHFEGVTVQAMVRAKGTELILGSSSDPQFGPVILFGTGGQFVEVFKDRALALPPLTERQARSLMQQTKVYEILKGIRGMQGVDIEALEDILVRFSHFISENSWVKECDINPLIAGPDGIIALDARILLHDPSIPLDQIPPLAIRPYPNHYIRHEKLKDGTPVTLRPIRPEDEPLIVEFHHELSENSVRQRYFEFVSLHERIAHERLIRICFNDYDRELALVAVIKDKKTQKPLVIGITRLTKMPGTSIGQIKMLIRDAYHQQGLGSLFLAQMVEIAKKEHLDKVRAYILSENTGMIKICQKLGFKIPSPDKHSVIQAELDLSEA